MKKNIAILAAVILLAVILFISYRFSNPASPLNSPSTTSTPNTSTSSAANNNPSAPKSLSYTQYVTQYVNRRIQFDAGCVAIPNILLVKTGTSIMLDNRAPVSRNVIVGGTAYSFKAYGFRILTMSASAFPKVLSVDCGTGRNNAQITIVR